MKAILMSIQSKWLAKILNGEKTVELRKRFPKDYRGWVYLYCTKAKPYLIRFFGRHFTTYYLASKVKDDGLVKNGLVVAKFTLNYVSTCLNTDYGNEEILKNACLTKQELDDYVGKRKFFAWHIENLVIFDKSKELGEFSVERYAEMPNGVFPCYEPIIKAPQSWQYVEVEK